MKNMCFTTPKVMSPFYRCKRIPRKLKKKITLSKEYLDINQLLWWYLEFSNPEYKKFLIQQLCTT